MYQKNKDIHLALLDYRNTPQQGQERSQLKGSYPEARRAYFQWHLRLSSLKSHILLQSKLKLVHVKPEQNNIMTEILRERHMKKFSLANRYMPNPTLSTSILAGLTALYRECPHPGHTLLSLLMVEKCAGTEHKSGWPQPHHLMWRPICPSKQVHPDFRFRFLLLCTIYKI